MDGLHEVFGNYQSEIDDFAQAVNDIEKHKRQFTPLDKTLTRDKLRIIIVCDH